MCYSKAIAFGSGSVHGENVRIRGEVFEQDFLGGFSYRRVPSKSGKFIETTTHSKLFYLHCYIVVNDFLVQN